MSDPDRSISERILDIFACRLGAVSEANGFRTSAGLRVFRARSSIDPKETPCFNVRGERTSARGASGASDSMDMSKTISVEFHVVANQASTGQMLELGLADAKRAILSRTNGGLSDDLGKIGGVVTYVGDECLPRRDGDQTESVTLTFTVDHKEAYGNPYAVR